MYGRKLTQQDSLFLKVLVLLRARHGHSTVINCRTDCSELRPASQTSDIYLTGELTEHAI